jgi:site-specific DNA-methyltransferase (adenine-specific)
VAKHKPTAEKSSAKPNALYYGDNLQILRENIATETIDLVYLDPPFNSQASYNVLFKAPTGEQSQAQIEAFEDTWHWNKTAEAAFDEVMQSGNGDVAEMLRAMRSFLKENDMMAYLTMMTVRLLELHRVLKPTGSLYLHCDPTASHYLKVLMDSIFGAQFFKNEIVWQRTSSHGNVSRSFGDNTDTIFFYTKTAEHVWNQLYVPYSTKHIETKFTGVEGGRKYTTSDLRNPGVRPNLTYDFTASNGITYKPHPNGWAVSREVMERYDREGRLYFPKSPDGRLRLKRFLDESPGERLQNLWDDIPPINSQAQERLGYQTQKPLALLERILKASTNEGDTVLDPFCGCGTAVHAAQKLKRNWVGIDITHLAISLVERRLKDAFPGIVFEVHGTPKDLDGARALAASDKYQFQWWAVSLVNAVPFGGKKKGADTGIDGLIYFKPEGKTTEKAVVSVKGGENVSVSMIRDFAHVVDREKARIGVFITLEEPTGPMQKEAIKTGFYETPYGKYPKVQILTIAELFEGKQPNIPLVDPTFFKKAQKELQESQDPLPF